VMSGMIFIVWKIGFKSDSRQAGSGRAVVVGGKDDGGPAASRRTKRMEWMLIAARESARDPGQRARLVFEPDYDEILADRVVAASASTRSASSYGSAPGKQRREPDHC